jgi:D-alanyl-D-alanine carboxypeptidase
MRPRCGGESYARCGCPVPACPAPACTFRGRIAHGYLPRFIDGVVEPVDVTDFNPSAAGASGELLSTTADLNRFYRALITGRLLRRDQLAQMRTTTPTGHDYDYGLGLQTRQLADGTTLWGHEGDFFGYQAASWTTDDGRRQITIAANPWGGGDLDGLIGDFIVTACQQH